MPSASEQLRGVPGLQTNIVAAHWGEAGASLTPGQTQEYMEGLALTAGLALLAQRLVVGISKVGTPLALPHLPVSLAV